MTFIVATLLGVLAVLAVAIVRLLVQRRALSESVEQRKSGNARHL